MDTRLQAEWQPLAVEPLLQSQEINPLESEGDAMRWGKLRRISSKIYGSSAPFGPPCVMHCSPKYILIGTQGSDVLVFDYQQELIAQMTPPAIGSADASQDLRCRYGPVTALNISKDESAIVAGYAHGAVVAWNIARPETPRKVVLPMTHAGDDATSKVHTNQTHLFGSIVCYVYFLGDKRSVIVSADNHGLIFIHQTVKLFMETRHRSYKLKGSYTPKVPTTLLACQELTIEGAPPLIAALSPYTLLAFTISPAKTHFRLSDKIDNIGTTTGMSGGLAWCEATNQLAYVWGDTLKVMSISWTGSQFVFAADKLFKSPESLVYVAWLDQKLLVALTITQKILFLDSDLRILDSYDVLRKYPLHHDYYSEVLRDSRDPVVADAFYLALQVQDSSLFILGRHELEYGTLTNWADRIMALLNNSRPVDAVVLATEYYMGDQDLSMIGLKPDTRKTVVGAALPDIILTSLRFCLQHDTEQLSKLLAVSLQAVASTGIPLLEQILELVESIDNDVVKEQYFEFLTSLVLDGSFASLPPHVFQGLVKAKAGSHELEHLIMGLDIATLDLNLAFELCDTYDLQETRVFLQTVALQDYVAPVKAMTANTFPYLSYVLSGRIFPTGACFSGSTRAKTQVYDLLFGPDHTVTIELIRKDAGAFFAALNEAFEDPLLNEDPFAEEDTDKLPVTRQIIVSSLLGIFSDKNMAAYEPYFNVFLARNLAKFKQYLMITGSWLDRILVNLCATKTVPHDERELAILALLSVYKPPNTQRLIQLLTEGDFFGILIKTYRSMSNYKQMLEVSLRAATASGHAPDPESLWSVADECLRNDYDKVFPLLVAHLQELVDIDASRLAALAIKRAPGLHLEALQIPHKSAYFDVLFRQIPTAGAVPPLNVCNDYVRDLAARDGEMLWTLLDKTLVRPEDVQLPAVVDALLENERIDALVLLMDRLDRDAEAMIYLTDYVANHSTASDRLIRQGIQLCTDATKSDRNAGVQQWTKFLDTLLTAGVPAEDALSSLVACDDSTVAITVLDKMLPVTKAGQMAPLIEGAFTTIREQEALLQTIKQVLDADLYTDFMAMLDERREGWSVSIDSTCEVCGGKIVGVGIDAEKLYRYWELRARGKKVDESDVLVIYRCGHCYHSSCLKRLDAAGCVLCSPSSHN